MYMSDEFSKMPWYMLIHVFFFYFLQRPFEAASKLNSGKSLHFIIREGLTWLIGYQQLQLQLQLVNHSESECTVFLLQYAITTYILLIHLSQNPIHQMSIHAPHIFIFSL